MSSFVAIACYAAAWISLLTSVRRKEHPGHLLNIMLTAGLIAHSFASYSSVFQSTGVILGLFQSASVLFLAMNVIVLISSLRLPLHNLFLLLMPMSVLALLIEVFASSGSAENQSLSGAMVTHILLSIVAYSLLTIATLQALLLSYQYSRLKSHHARAVIGVFPPLQTMESLLFDLVRAGFVLLTLSIGTGIFFIENIFEQKLSHKLTFSLLSWAIYLVLLIGRHVLAWRGKLAIRCVLAGFVMLMLAYFGSKFVLEFLLS